MLLQSNLKKIEYLALLFLDSVSYDVKNYADLGGWYRGRSLSSAEAPAWYPNNNSNTNKIKKVRGGPWEEGKGGSGLSPSHRAPRAVFFFLPSQWRREEADGSIALLDMHTKPNPIVFSK